MAQAGMPIAPQVLIAVYAVPLIGAGAAWALYHTRRSRRARAQAAHGEPAGLYPLIDPMRCIGCGACVAACPEVGALGMIGRTATLIAPAACVGHGDCAPACPADAIRLVMGSAHHAVDLPIAGPDGATSVPGIHVAGELAGAGLIRHAVAQGVRVIEAIATDLAGTPCPPDAVDVAIVGFGPAGLAASLGAIDHGLSLAVFDQDSPGGSIAHYPRGKLVHTGKAVLPILGDAIADHGDKDSLLQVWTRALAETGLQPRFNHRITQIVRDGDTLLLNQTVRARRVILATGRGGTPRRLGIPGEDLPKVSYRLGSPAHHAGEHVLVIGGGDAAIEAALALAEVAQITLAHRGADFPRAQTHLVRALADTPHLTTLRETRLVALDNQTATLEHNGIQTNIPNDAVIACTGGTTPTDWLAGMGITMRRYQGDPLE